MYSNSLCELGEEEHAVQKILPGPGCVGGLMSRLLRWFHQLPWSTLEPPFQYPLACRREN